MNKTRYTLWKNNQLYPPLLHEIGSPPKRLFIEGQQLNPADTYFAIVGTRHPSSYGKQMAEEFAAALARHGFVIVSGLAYGIDTIAHTTALDVGGRTIAVLGSGLNNITPPSNKPLAEKIKKDGCIISEYEADQPAFKGTFPQRNRIIAGMSPATLVIEAPEISGALITARLALDANRDVFALPANITQESSIGTNRLIRDGKAFPVTCVQDIFDYMQITHKSTLPQGPALTPDEDKIYTLLKKSSRSIEELITETSLSASKVTTIVSLLELKGLVTLLGSHAFITR